MAPKRNMKKASAVRKNSVVRPVARMKGLMVVSLSAAGVAVMLYILAITLRPAFTLDKVVFSGNSHLGDEDLRNLAGLKGGENLLRLSGRQISGKMQESPWLRSVSTRKEFPGKLHIRVEEAVPFALLDLKGRLFLLDDKGRMLEEIKDRSIPFLPVIAGDPYVHKEIFTEALNLVGAIKESGLIARKDHIEIIAHKQQEMAMNLDGVVVKVGAGEYRDKLGRFLELEEEIKRRAIPVDYIDLRFANRVVVKPVHEVIK